MTLHQEQGSSADTGDDNFTPSTQKQPSGSPMYQVARLKEYLATSWPDAAAPGEHAADTAIRLLQGMTAASNRLTEVHDVLVSARCETQYCNQPRGHEGEHGWVNYQ